MPEAKIDLDIDNSMNGTIIITCGGCSRKTKVPLKQASPGKKVKCSCGNEFHLQGDDLRKMQKGLDDFQKTLKQFGK